MDSKVKVDLMVSTMLNDPNTSDETKKLIAELLTDEKFEEVIKFSGSELVFYQSIKNNLNPVICVDNRIELGLMSNIEERLLRDILEVLKNNQASKKTRNNIKVILDRLNIVIQQFKLIQESGDNQDYYKDYQNLYDLYQEIFGRQILILERLNKNNRKSWTTVLDVLRKKFLQVK